MISLCPISKTKFFGSLIVTYIFKPPRFLNTIPPMIIIENKFK